MKKFFLLLTLAMISVTSWAVSITVNPTSVDFGTVSIKGKTSVEGSATINVTYSGLQPYCSVYFEDDEMPESGAIFSLEGTNTAGVIYGGDQYNPAEGQGLQLHYYADKAGTYTGRIRFYSYTDAEWTIKSDYVYLNIKLVVSGDAEIATTSTYQRLNSTGDLQSGDTVVFISESAGAVCGPLNGAYLTAVTENVKIDKVAGTAEVPEGVQTFVLNKYSGNWQFLYPDDNEKALLLDYSSNSGRGAFSTTYEVGKTVKSWEISISNGVASVIRPNDADPAYPVRFNSDRFKPYQTEATGTSIAIYKKVGPAQPIESKLEVGDVVFGEVENDEQKSVTVNYTAENLTDDIVWAIEGTDAALFDVADQGDRTSGTVTVTYKGTSNKTGALDARLSYLTQDIALDPMEGSKVISITLIPATVKLTGLAFEGAPATIDQGQTIDLSQYVVYTPNNAADKSLTWAVDHTYQGEVDQDGKLTAKRVTGTVTVTATSVRVPSVSASVTLTITKPTITDFTLSKTETTLNIGGQETLTITAFVPAYASESATWASANADIAKVNKNGVITAMGLGDTEITATIGEVEKTCTVHVVAVAVNSITLPAEANVTLGSSLQLNPTVDPAQAASEYTITYESSAPEIATVDANGKVAGVAAGDAIITATIADKSAQITIHVVAAQMFSKVTDASTLAAKDTIILATIYERNGVIAGARDGKKLTVLLNDVTVTETEAYADNACRFVLGTENGKEGFTLTIVGGKTIAVTSSGNDIVDANTQNCKFWEFVADGDKGYFVRNLGNTNAMFKYHAGNAAIKPYKTSTTGAVYVYAYVRKYVEPGPATNVENTEVETKAQKVLQNGQILILRGDAVYTITGVRVK
ncbi:MAG: Ig-like domain-containing protein [Paludibacteraceae bacterium]|nr:Ig-like domain-containing protein [Paludibacteraceae bacterium]MDD6747223.1 Ig-like domain-containing protein [Paludibacteraceae bacterium]